MAEFPIISENINNDNQTDKVTTIIPDNDTRLTIKEKTIAEIPDNIIFSECI